MSRRLLWLAVALGLAALSGCSHTSSAAVKVEKDRKIAPDFKLKDADGRTVSLSDYRGKVILLNFFATWCGPCKVEIPWFTEFEQKYRSQGFAVLGVSMDDDGWEAVKPFLAERKVNYRVVLGNDMTSDLYGGVDSLPTTFIIDQQGRIAQTHVGLVARSDYENEIVHLLHASNRAAVSGGSGALLARAR